LGDILNTVPGSDLQSRPDANFPAIRRDIVFDHATFRYRIDGPKVLHDVSFHVPPKPNRRVVGPGLTLGGKLNKIPRLGYCAGVRSDAH